jgi:hypothetical protein
MPAKILIIIFGVFFLPLFSSAQKLPKGTSACLAFDSVVTLKGKIRSVKFRDPNSHGTVKEWVLHLDKPFCIVDAQNDTIRNQSDIQLLHSLWFDKTLRKRIDNFVHTHKRVTITGRLDYQNTGYDFLTVLIDVDKIK